LDIADVVRRQAIDPSRSVVSNYMNKTTLITGTSSGLGRATAGGVSPDLAACFARSSATVATCSELSHFESRGKV
jgi:NAD(P)-dependent dehydrogenase (short-subunit alcohol dehydrogenase family)